MMPGWPMGCGVPVSSTMAMWRPGCGLPDAPPVAGLVGLAEMKVEHSDMP